LFSRKFGEAWRGGMYRVGFWSVVLSLHQQAGTAALHKKKNSEL